MRRGIAGIIDTLDVAVLPDGEELPLEGKVRKGMADDERKQQGPRT
jgi:hypothetical protein